MPYKYRVDDEVKVRVGGQLLEGKIIRLGVFGDKYALYGAPTVMYPEEDVILVRKAEQYGGRKSRRNRRRRQNKKYSRRR
jgi:hypothetical protein